MHLGFENLCKAVAYDQNITNLVSEAKITVQIGFMNLCAACASILSNFWEHPEKENIFI